VLFVGPSSSVSQRCGSKMKKQSRHCSRHLSDLTFPLICRSLLHLRSSGKRLCFQYPSFCNLAACYLNKSALYLAQFVIRRPSCFTGSHSRHLLYCGTDDKGRVMRGYVGIIEQGCSVMEYLACISSFLRQYCCWFWRCVFCLVPSQLCPGTEKVPEVYKATAAGEPVSETANLLSPRVL